MKNTILFTVFLCVFSSAAFSLDYKFTSPVRAGKAPLIVFIHGALQDHRFIEKDEAGFHAIGYATLSVSLPGLGNDSIESDFFGPKDYQLVRDFLQSFLLQQQGRILQTRLAFYGYSLGGIVAARLVVNDYPEAKLVLESTPIDLLSEMQIPENYLFSGFELLEQKAYRETKKTLFRAMIPGPLSEQQLAERSLLPILAGKQVDFMIFFGDQDFRYPSDYLQDSILALSAATLSPGARIWIKPMGHELPSRNPLELGELRDFLLRY